jgi:MFS transporter, ACS family, pantothenate transporter
MEYNEDKFAKANITTYPLGIQAVAIVTNLCAAVYIDATDRRVPIGILAGVLQLISACLLLDPNLSVAGTFFAYYNAGTSYMINPLLFGWANVICQRGGDEALRSMILFCMNAFANILYTFWGIALYAADDAPYWRNGCIAMIVVIVFMLGLLWVVRWVSYESNPTRSLPSVQLPALKCD